MKIKADIYDEKKAKPKDLLWQKRVYKKDDMREFFKLCKTLDGLCSAKKRAAYGGGGGRGGRGGGGALQNCVVKCRIGKDMAAHRKFLNEYMPQKNKDGVEEKPELFSAGVVGEEDFKRYEEKMAGRHFKFVISPENQRVDNEALARTLAKRMEAAAGRKFSWLAVVHKDTAHKHVHLLVNGADAEGEDLRFSRDFIKRGMREMARRICTEMVGARSRREVEAERSGLYKRRGYCRLDEELSAYERGIASEGGRWGGEVGETFDVVLRRRLERLVEMGLAERKAAGGPAGRRAYLMEKGWRETLKAAGRYNSFLRARVEEGFSKLELYGRNSGAVSGKVRRVYVMNDEENWNHAVVIENCGKAWYVPLYCEPERGLLGKEVRCEMRERQSGLLAPTIREAGVRGLGR
jgi:hypothetical protein